MGDADGGAGQRRLGGGLLRPLRRPGEGRGLTAPVLVTGGTGYVGGLLLRGLAAQGRPLRALVRRPGDRDRLPVPAETVVGSLEDEESLVRAATGCEVVYHAAGMNRLCLRNPVPLLATNVDGTRRLLAAARRAGARRVVYTSSAAVLGGDGVHPVDEGAPAPERFTSQYARSKALAEKVALGFHGIEVVAVNPSSVQGPGRTTGTARLLIDYLNGRLRFDLRTRFGLCYADDCVAGHLLAEAKGMPGERYLLNTATVSGAEAIELVAGIAGLSERPTTLPYPVALAGAAVVEALAAARGRPPRLCREVVRTARHPHLYDGSRAERELGLSYTPLRDALAATVRWYVEVGLVRRRLPGLERKLSG